MDTFKSLHVVVTYQIVLKNFSITDNIAETIHDDICTSNKIPIPCSDESSISIIDNNKIEVSFDIKDPLFNIIKERQIDYNNLCMICNNMYSRINFGTCERCVSINNVPLNLRDYIINERNKVLNFQYETKITESAYVYEEDDEFEYDLILISVSKI